MPRGRVLWAGKVPEREPRSLALSEWLVLCVICEQPTHGFAALLGYRS